MSRRLLIISCSQRKRTGSQSLAAIDRYDGVNFKVLRKLRTEGALPSDLDVFIISAKYGLLRSNKTIDWYEKRMTRQQAMEMSSRISRKFDRVVLKGEYGEIFINLGKDYMHAISSSQTITANNVIYAIGGIGKKTAQMKNWIINNGIKR